MAPRGYHLLVNCVQCDKEKIQSASCIKEFTQHLVKQINMKAFGEPTIVHFATHTPAAAGYSLLQLIETSSITGHFCDASGDAYIDIFSCKKFENKDVLKCIEMYFSPLEVLSVMHIRSGGLLKIEESVDSKFKKDD